MKKTQPFGLAVAVLLISLTMLLLTLPGAAQNPVRRVVIKAGQMLDVKAGQTLHDQAIAAMEASSIRCPCSMESTPVGTR